MMNAKTDYLSHAVSSGAISGEMATRVMEGQNKLRMLDEAERELGEGLGRYVRGVMGERERGEFLDCLRVNLWKGFEAQREILRRRMEGDGAWK